MQTSGYGASTHHCRAAWPERQQRAPPEGCHRTGGEASESLKRGFSQNKLYERAVGWESAQGERRSNSSKPLPGNSNEASAVSGRCGVGYLFRMLHKKVRLLRAACGLPPLSAATLLCSSVDAEAWLLHVRVPW